MTEMEGQMTLFDHTTEQPDEECQGCAICQASPCKHCGGFCASSRECVEIEAANDPT